MVWLPLRITRSSLCHCTARDSTVRSSPRRGAGDRRRYGALAVIGFDDIEYGALTTPALTTVHVDAEAHGRQAARAVLGLEPGDLAHPPGYVIVRDSA